MFEIDRSIALIVIHCADTPNGRPVSALEIDAWHAARRFTRTASARKLWQPNLTSIGYHHVIEPDGSMQDGRHWTETGAHVFGYNAHSLGICLAGRDAYTPAAWARLAALVRHLADQFAIPLQAATQANMWQGIAGHNEFPHVTKACPGFSVADWIARGFTPGATP